MNKGSTSICVLFCLLLHITVFGQKNLQGTSGQPEIVPRTLVFKIDQTAAGKGSRSLNPDDLPFSIQGIKPISSNSKLATRGGKASVLEGIYKVQLAPGEDVRTKCMELLKYNNVLYAEPIFQEQLFYIPSDPQANPEGGAQSYLGVIKAYEAWDITQGSEDIIVGVIDTGADMDHEDLVDDIYVNEAEIINGIDDDGNGFIDDRTGYDFANQDNDPEADRGKHGTLVGGLAAADTDNGVGIAGLGFKSKLMPLKAFTSEANISFGTYDAIIYAADNGVDVLNLSWGSINSYSQFNQDIINYAVLENDVVIVAAAGNNNQDVEYYPASYANVLSVGATDNSDSKSSFSTYSNKVDLVAPGSAIYSTSNDGYGSDYGTSYSSPIVAGVAALVRAEFPELNARQVMERIRATADDIYGINSSPMLAGKLGKGRLNAAQAVGDTTVKAARITDFDAYGRDGGNIYFGDSIYIDFTIENFLDSIENLTVSFTTYDEEITFESLEIGSMATFDVLSFTGIKGLVSDEISPGSTIEIRIELEDGEYTDFQQFSIQIAPDRLDFTSGQALMTLAGNGELGRVEAGSTGNGVQLAGNWIADQVGLILTTSDTEVADNAPTLLSSGAKNLDFQVEEHIRPYYNSIADQYTRNVFHDRGEIGIKIEQSAMAWDAQDSAMILDYRIINTSGSDLLDLSAGTFWNWDLVDETKNHAEWDGNNTAYTWDDANELFAGVRLVGEGSIQHAAIDINTYNGNAIDASLLTDSLKYAYLNTTDFDEAGTMGEGNDVAQILGMQLDTLKSDDHVAVTFLIAFGKDLSSLTSRLDELEQRHQSFVQSPPLAATFYSCEGAFTDIDMIEGTQFNFYSDALGTDLIGTGNTIAVGPITADTTIYVAQADSTYEGAINSASVIFIEQVANFDMDKDVLYLGGGSNIVSFTDQSFEATSWKWDFGNGDATTIQHPKLVYSKAGTYTIELSVKTKEGCMGSITKDLQVIDRPSILGIDRMEICAGEDVVIEGTGNDGLRVYATATDTASIFEGEAIVLQKVTKDTTLLIANVIDGFESERETVTIDVTEVSPTYEMMPALDSLQGNFLWLVNTTGQHQSLTWSVDGELISSNDTLTLASTAGNYDIELVAVNDIGCAGTLARSIAINESTTPTYDSPSVICKADDVIIDPSNGTYFGFYSDAGLQQALHKGNTFTVDSVVAPTTIFIAGLDNGLTGDAVAVNLTPNDLSFEIIPEMPELYLDRGRNVHFGLDTALSLTSWYLDDTFYDASSDPIINFEAEGLYDIKVDGTDSDGCSYIDSLSFQVWARTPLVLNVDPGKDTKLSIYPNPSSEYIHLMTDDLVAHLSVFDTQGKQLMTKSIPNAAAGRNAHGLAISHLPEGPYILRVIFADGRMESRRFLKE